MVLFPGISLKIQLVEHFESFKICCPNGYMFDVHAVIILFGGHLQVVNRPLALRMSIRNAKCAHQDALCAFEQLSARLTRYQANRANDA